MSDERWRIIVIYRRPKDYPDFAYVAREYTVGDRGEMIPALEVFATGDTLAQVRHKIPLNLVCVGRSTRDDPTIVETWV